jgi:hypothetical protein
MKLIIICPKCRHKYSKIMKGAEIMKIDKPDRKNSKKLYPIGIGATYNCPKCKFKGETQAFIKLE